MKNGRKNSGQVLLEYVLVVLVVVGAAYAAYQVIRPRMQQPMDTIKSKFQGDAWSGGRPLSSYYKQTEYIKRQ